MAFLRYVAGEDIYVPLLNVTALRLALNRFAHDAIHNIVARSRMPLADGGYRRVCASAERSVRAVLSNPENARSLLKMHWPQEEQERHKSEEERQREEREVAVLPSMATT